jgi:hypothetical protein
MSEQPSIYKHVNPKTQALLRASAKHREESAKDNSDNMSNEQT